MIGIRSLRGFIIALTGFFVTIFGLCLWLIQGANELRDGIETVGFIGRAMMHDAAPIIVVSLGVVVMMVGQSPVLFAVAFREPRFKVEIHRGTPEWLHNATIAVRNVGFSPADGCTARVVRLYRLSNNRASEKDTEQRFAHLLPFNLKWVDSDGGATTVTKIPSDGEAHIVRVARTVSTKSFKEDLVFDFVGQKPQFQCLEGWYRATIVVSGSHKWTTKSDFDVALSVQWSQKPYELKAVPRLQMVPYSQKRLQKDIDEFDAKRREKELPFVSMPFPFSGH